MPAYGWGGMGRICGKKDTSGVPSVVYGYVQTSAHRDGMLHRASEISASLLGKARRTLCHKLCHSDLCEASVQSFSLAIAHPRPNGDAEAQQKRQASREAAPELYEKAQKAR